MFCNRVVNNTLIRRRTFIARNIISFSDFETITQYDAWHKIFERKRTHMSICTWEMFQFHENACNENFAGYYWSFLIVKN